MTNRLIHEKSPYLLQHAHNPVDWYPWGDEAFEKARREDKPILLSIGYSTCHWCHVMEHESFEKTDIAAVMNDYLVNIKLDREERPDLDKIYMTAVTAMAGSGGWPLNVFLTPDLKPFWGGTYFPPEERWGRPGWPQIVERIGQAWRDPAQRKEIMSSGENMVKALQQYLGASVREAGALREDALKNGFQSFRMSYDGALGGFSPAPKFPMPVNQTFLFRYYDRARRVHKDQAEAKEVLAMTLDTLRAMARGGIYDQIGGGFHRYSTDERWHIPHFEKMLYDNAQLTVNFLEAFQITREPEFERVARETLEYIRRDMTHPEGAFYSAEDADSLPGPGANHKVEGAFYVWSIKELRGLLGAESAEIASFHYGAEPDGNAQQDPHGEFTGKNILFQAHSVEETAKKFVIEAAKAAEVLEKSREQLLAVRAKRPRPHLDDKILSSWNGLMITAFSRAHQILVDEEYLTAARRAAEFICERLYDPAEKTLYRRWRDGHRSVRAMADDYAFLTQAFLDLYEASFEARWLEWAEKFCDKLIEDFYDEETGTVFMTDSRGQNLILRVREDTDNVEPSAASISAIVFLRLSHILDRQDLRAAADKILAAHIAVMEEQPRAFPQMLSALDLVLRPPLQIVLAAETDGGDFPAFAKEAHRRFLPHRTLILKLGSSDGPLKRNAFLDSLPVKAGKVTGYVCVNFACKLPASDVTSFAHQLDEL